MIVDSCCHPDLSEPTPLHYLRSIGVDPAEAVDFVVATHWHDDHLKGIAEVFEACSRACFVCSSALKTPDFQRLVTAYSSPGHPHSGVDELSTILVGFSERSGDLRRLKWAAADMRLASYRSPNVEVSVLSPSHRACSRAFLNLQNLTSNLLKPGQAKRSVPSPGANEGSIALWISTDDESILLGGDIEESFSGWTEILRNPLRPNGTASYLKVSHHGSKNGDHPEIWTQLLTKNAHACVSPFYRGRVALPTVEDIGRLKLRTSRAFITSVERPRKSTKNTAVEKTLRDAVKNRRTIPTSRGQIRTRMRSPRYPESVELLNGATQL